MVVLEQVVEVPCCLLTLDLLGGLVLLFLDTILKFYTLMLVLSRLAALLTPVDGITLSYAVTAGLTSEYSLGQLQQTDLALTALHVGLGDKLATVLGRTLARWNLLLLEPMRMRSVVLVALEAETEVFTFGAVEPIHELGDGLHAAVAAVPHIVAIFQQLFMSGFLSLLGDRLAHFVLEVLLEFLLRVEVVVAVGLQFFALVLKQFHVDDFVGLDVVFVLIFSVLIVLFTEHL